MWGYTSEYILATSQKVVCGVTLAQLYMYTITTTQKFVCGATQSLATLPHNSLYVRHILTIQ